MNGGEIIAKVLQNHGVKFLFTLCGGHISPIFVSAEKLGIRVIDTRHEANAVFAADAVSRLTGIPGVAKRKFSCHRCLLFLSGCAFLWESHHDR